MTEDALRGGQKVSDKLRDLAQELSKDLEFADSGSLLERDIIVATLQKAVEDATQDRLNAACARFLEHTNAVAAFMNELYAIMVDPCADEPIKVADMQKALIEAAKRDCEAAHQRAALAGACEVERGERLEQLVERLGDSLGSYMKMASDAELVQFGVFAQAKDALDEAAKVRHEVLSRERSHE